MYAPAPSSGGWLSQGNNKWIVAIGGIIGLVVIFMIMGRGGSSGGGVVSGGQSSDLTDQISTLNDLIANAAGGGGGGGGGASSGSGFTGGNPGDAIYTPPLSPTQPPSNNPYPGYGTTNPTSPILNPVSPTPVATAIPTPTHSPTSGISAVGPVANPVSFTAQPKGTVAPKTNQPSTYIASPSLVANPANVGYPGSATAYSGATTVIPKPVNLGKSQAVVSGSTSSSVDKSTAIAASQGFGGGGSWGSPTPTQTAAQAKVSTANATASSKEQAKPVATTSSKTPKVAPKQTNTGGISGVAKTSTKAQ